MTTDSLPREYNGLCERRHPEYQNKVDHWGFLNSTYESSRAWFKENIFKFTREGDETYAGRLLRAYRFNHTREVVDLVNKYLFKTAPQRSEDVPEYLKRFRKRATMSGLAIEDFERQVSRLASIYGRVYVVVDNNASDEVVTVADEKSGAVKLYAYTVKPQDFLDCGYDDNGRFKWVLLREIQRDDDDPFNCSGHCEELFRLWTTDKWYLFEPRRKRNKVTWTLKAEGEHNLGMVPVIKADHIESDNRYAVPALIEDIAYLDRAIANYLSNLDQIINDQTFSQLVMPAQGVLGTSGVAGHVLADETDPDTIKAARRVVKMGTSQIMLFDGEGGMAPSYIAPDPRQANLIITTIKQVINEIYHTVGLAGERTKQDNSQGIDNSSGVAKAYDFEKVNGLLSAKANAMQNFANRLEGLARAWNGEKDTLDQPEEPAVLYSTNFDVRSLSDDLAIAQQLSLLSVPMEVRQVQLTGIVEKIWPMMSAAQRKKLEKAIANWEDEIYSLTPAANNPPAKGKSSVTETSHQGEVGQPKKQ